jgi:hypothetical protein
VCELRRRDDCNTKFEEAEGKKDRAGSSHNWQSKQKNTQRVTGNHLEVQPLAYCAVPKFWLFLGGTSISRAGRLDKETSQGSCHAARDLSAYETGTLIN